jgi:hypothetical protein
VFLFVCAGHCLSQSEFVDGVHLTTTKAPWTMQIPGNDLQITKTQTKPDGASAYFMMTSKSKGLNVSVFIEPVDRCRSADECRDHVFGSGNPAWGKYQDLGKGRIKDFSYFEFYRPEVGGVPLKVFDMYAEFVSQGYWVDLHISKVLYTKADHVLFEKLINSIAFSSKNATAASEFDSPLRKGDSAVSSWLGLWDNGKGKESYAALAGDAARRYRN